MTLKIIHKNNTSAGQAPASGDLDIGEIAVNSADAKLYTKDNDGAIQEFISKFEQTGSGAVKRTVESKLQDVVSVKDFGAVGDGVTDDTTAIQAAVNTNANLYWGSGGEIYNVTSNVANLLSKPHYGKAKITSNGNTYHIGEDWIDNANTVYIGASGVSSNDGLSSANPLDLTNGFNNFIRQVNSCPSATWTLKLLAGTYTDGPSRSLQKLRPTSNVVTIEGEVSGGIPTTIFDGWTTSVIRSFDNSSFNLILKDLKFINITASEAVLMWYGNYNLLAQNLHADNVNGVAFSFRDAAVDFRGGIINNCDSGVVMQNVYGSVGDDGGYSGTYSSTFTNISGSAVAISRGSIAYVRNSIFTNNDVHIDISRIARVRTQSNTFNSFVTAAVRQNQGPTVWNDDPSNYDNFPGAAINTSPVLATGGSIQSRYNRSGSLVGHLYYNDTINFTGTTRAEPAITNLAPFRPAPFWLLSPTAYGEVEYEILCPVAETITLEINGEGSSVSSRLANISFSAAVATYKVKFEITGPSDGGTQGKYWVSAIGTNGDVFASRGATASLTSNTITGTTATPKRFRFYVTRSDGTGNLQIRRMISSLMF